MVPQPTPAEPHLILPKKNMIQLATIQQEKDVTKSSFLLGNNE